MLAWLVLLQATCSAAMEPDDEGKGRRSGVRQTSLPASRSHMGLTGLVDRQAAEVAPRVVLGRRECCAAAEGRLRDLMGFVGHQKISDVFLRGDVTVGVGRWSE
jgi:hypothetical protein